MIQQLINILSFYDNMHDFAKLIIKFPNYNIYEILFNYYEEVMTNYGLANTLLFIPSIFIEEKEFESVVKIVYFICVYNYNF